MIEQIFEYFSGMGSFWALFFVSVIPFIELRGAIPFGILVLNMPWYEVFFICFLSNCLPVLFVILLTRPIFSFLKKTKRLSGFVERIENKMMKKSEKVTKYKIIGLFLFVAVPLPGTGAYSGSVIAALLDMPLLKAVLSIICGILVAGVLITILSVCGDMALL